MKAWFCAGVGLAALLGCTGGSGGKDARSAEIACPPGQTFDGQYCRVDQTVATVETEVRSSEEVAPADAAPAEVVPAEAVSAEQTPPDPSADAPGTTTTDAAADDSSLEHAEQEPEPKTPAHAAPVDYAMAAQAAPVMQYLSHSHLPQGARALAAPFAGQFAEGQILEQKVQLVAGKCYTVVALALPPVSELTVELLSEAEPTTVLARDEDTGPQAVLGSRDRCYLAERSGPARLRLTVEKGRGVAAAQVFAK